MKLIFLHGPAAAGKLTIAKELNKLLGYPVFHNHLVVDLLLEVFPFGSPPFSQLRELFWLATFEQAAAHGRSIIFTFSPEKTVSHEFIQNVVTTIEQHQGEVVFVPLVCPEDVLLTRLDAPSRRDWKKLRSVEVFREIRAKGLGEYPPLPSSGLEIDTSQCDPISAARRIVDSFALVPAEG